MHYHIDIINDHSPLNCKDQFLAYHDGNKGCCWTLPRITNGLVFTFLWLLTIQKIPEYVCVWVRRLLARLWFPLKHSRLSRVISTASDVKKVWTTIRGMFHSVLCISFNTGEIQTKTRTRSNSTCISRFPRHPYIKFNIYNYHWYQASYQLIMVEVGYRSAS